MGEIRDTYAQHCRLNGIVGRPICNKYMCPITAYMLSDDVQAFTNGTGGWAGGRRLVTLEDAKPLREEWLAGVQRDDLVASP